MGKMVSSRFKDTPEDQALAAKIVGAMRPDTATNWTCNTCQTGEMSTVEFAAHMKDVHGLEKPEGQRIRVYYGRGEGFTQYGYAWKVGDLDISQTVRVYGGGR